MDSEVLEADRPRTASEVAQRCLALYAVLSAGHEEPRDELIHWLRRERLWEAVSPQEAIFLQSSTPTRQQMIGATWRAEALFPLLWSLGYIDDLPPATALCDVPLLQSVLPALFESTTEFLSKAALRDEVDILQVHEETYQAHWTVRDARINNRPVPHGYNPGVVQERHLALNWLTGYDNQDWDQVSTDT